MIATAAYVAPVPDCPEALGRVKGPLAALAADAPLKRVFVSLCAIEAPEDGLTFLPESVHVEAIREDQEYGGMRVKLLAMLGNVRIPLQVDVGAGDAVVPPPEVLDYPSLLDLPRARIRVDRREDGGDG